MGSLEPPVSNLNCFGKFCKWLFYVFNVLFLVTGVAGIAIGIWAIVDPTSMRIVVLTNSKMYIMGAYLLVGSGVAAVFVAVAGCFGARYESRCLLTIYFIILLMIFVAEFSGGVLALAFYTQMKAFANEEMRLAIVSKYGMANHFLATDAFNYMQDNYDCCGWSGTGLDAAQLYQISDWFFNSMIQVPPSCCKRGTDGEPLNRELCQSKLNNDINYVNNVGCLGAVLNEGGKFATIISGTGIGLAVLQIFGLIFAFCLWRRI